MPRPASAALITARPVNGRGDAQIPGFQDTVPQGAHGYHQVTATVR